MYSLPGELKIIIHILHKTLKTHRQVNNEKLNSLCSKRYHPFAYNKIYCRIFSRIYLWETIWKNEGYVQESYCCRFSAIISYFVTYFWMRELFKHIHTFHRVCWDFSEITKGVHISRFSQWNKLSSCTFLKKMRLNF